MSLPKTLVLRANTHLPPPHNDLIATFKVERELLTLIAKSGLAEITSHSMYSPDLELETNHDATIDLLEAKLAFEKFAAEHCKITVHTAGKEYEFMALMMAT